MRAASRAMATVGTLTVSWVPFVAGCGASQPPPAAHAPTATQAAVAVPAPSVPEDPWALDALARGAVRLEALGDHRRKVTASPEAQAFFDQGLALTYGFNHDEAARSFARAGALDPSCAMCFWGAAYTLGPNYNFPMMPDRARAAWDAVSRAQAAAPGTTPVEQALVAAIAKRYGGPEYVDPAAMQPFHQAYADAMRDVATRFPDDLDVQTLFAEALMNLNPWKLWDAKGEPAPGTEEIVRVLEGVLAKDPSHPGANHYYIHAVEASRQPERAVAAADRLGALVPAAGHLVHMPAHVYQRVGRYADASAANVAAVDADERYLASVTPPGYYPFYVSHNHGFLAYSASMEGRGAEALAAARRSASAIPTDVLCGMPGMDFFVSEPLLVLVRFGRWDEVLAEPEPEAKYSVLRAFWHHARGMAFAAKGRPDDAKPELEAVARIAKEIPPDLLTGLNSGALVLDLARQALAARIAEAEKRADAIEAWEAAVAIEDQLSYNEPADWFYPTRHYLGAALLAAGRAKEAEAVYRSDLERNPKNGWGLFGLWKALAAQKRTKEAKAVEKEFRAAWARADVELARSAF